MSNIDVKTAGQIMRERYYEIKKNRKFSPEIKEILEKHKEEFLKIKIDIKEKKITLPLIYALNKAGNSEKRRIINLVKNHNEESDKVSEVIDFVRNSGGLDYARSRMDAYQQEAFTILNDLPEHESRDSLQQLVRFTTERKK